MSYINTCFRDLLHLLYPVVCVGCGSDTIGKDQVICLECHNNLPFTNFHLHHENPVERMFYGRLPLVAATSVFYFAKKSIIQSIVHQLKYRGRSDVGLYLGKITGDLIRNSEKFRDIDLTVPLPLHKQRQKKRGYNQAELICEGIAATTGIPMLNDVVRRKTLSTTQTHKNRTERWNNMQGMFELVRRTGIENRHVLLVDDVITTGATLEACGLELMKVPDIRLSIVSLAYTSS